MGDGIKWGIRSAASSSSLILQGRLRDISKIVDIMIYSFGTRVQITFISKLAEANDL